MRDLRNTCKIFIGERKGKDHSGDQALMGIRYFKETGCEGVEGINLAQDRVPSGRFL
jgi:hypothetical protein